MRYRTPSKRRKALLALGYRELRSTTFVVLIGWPAHMLAEYESFVKTQLFERALVVLYVALAQQLVLAHHGCRSQRVACQECARESSLRAPRVTRDTRRTFKL